MKPALAKLGVWIDPFYDRTDLVKKTVNTVAKSLIEGGILVIFVLFIMGLAAAEVAIALSIIIAVYRNYRSIASTELSELKG